MTQPDPRLDGLYSEAHQFTFSEKTWTEFTKEFLKYLYPEVGTFLATAIALWGGAEVIAAATEQRAPLESLAVPVLATALMVALYRAYRKQADYVPEVLASESAAVKQIFRQQRCGWNAALAREMLSDRIQAAEATLERIKRGAEYIEPVRLEFPEYFAWLQTRPEATQRLVRAAMVLVTSDLPTAVGQATAAEDLAAVKNEIEALAEVYNSARDLEIECHRLVPPEGFESIHEMTFGWTDTVRDGVKEFCRILDSLSAVDSKELLKGDVPQPTFSITIEAPENVEEFNKRLEATASPGCS